MATEAAGETQRAALIELITACWKTQAIGEGVALGLFDALADGPASSVTLAARADANADGVMRLLRALAVLGLVEHRPGNSFALTPMGALLRRDAPDSLNGMAGHWGKRIWDSFGRLGDCVRTGEASVPAGPEHFAQMQADEVEADIFNRSMAEGSLLVGRALARAYDFSGFRRLMDVGGGYGALLVGPLEAAPHLTGTVCDLPALEPSARRWQAEQSVAARLDYAGGDFFARVPPGADCILLKYILHDWDDARCRTILRHCREAVSDGTILIVERIVPETVTSANADVIRGDLIMLGVGGKERTRAEYETLLAEAGLAIAGVTPIENNFSIIAASAI